MSFSFRVLIIEADPEAAALLAMVLQPRQCFVRFAGTGQEAREALATWRPELVLMDLMLPDIRGGLDLLRHFRETSPQTPVIMMTGSGSVANAVEAMGAGAVSIIEKPIKIGALTAMLEKAGEKLELAAENRRCKEEPREQRNFGNMIAHSDPMRHLFHLIKSFAPTDANVLVHGESGTGKELVATAIHQHSKHAAGPFIKINCSAIPSELIESELFGHKRGAFTGAVSDHTGLMELAEGGSLLLDEIGEMPAHVQVKLLRVLQDREFRAVGGTSILKPSFRLICATNANLDTMLGRGKLRNDLYFRVNTMTLSIPPLRDRTDDILLLAEHFLHRFSTQHQRNIASIHPGAVRLLLRYHWPGNVRQLEHVIERAVIVAEGTQITADALPPEVTDIERLQLPAAFVTPPHHTLEEIEKLAILQTLERTHGNKRETASILGIYRPTLYNKLKKHGLMSTVHLRPSGGTVA
jgi:DNA-binding NtrC family response regulator